MINDLLKDGALVKQVEKVKVLVKAPEVQSSVVDGRIIPAGCEAVVGPEGRVGVFDPMTGRTYY